MHRYRRWLLLGMLCVLLALVPSPADDGPPQCQNPLAIDWVLPGDFEAARTRSRKENRILMVKGIAFGIDEVGARNAKKGCW